VTGQQPSEREEAGLDHFPARPDIPEVLLHPHALGSQAGVATISRFVARFRRTIRTERASNATFEVVLLYH